jgi:sortase A
MRRIKVIGISTVVAGLLFLAITSIRIVDNKWALTSATKCWESGIFSYDKHELVGRLLIPEVEIDTIILGDDNSSALEIGPVLVTGSVPPGKNGNLILAGHRDTVFRNLAMVETGDTIKVETLKKEMAYVVISRNIIDPEDVRLLEPTKTNCITLVTCFPFTYIGTANQRYIIRGISL